MTVRQDLLKDLDNQSDLYNQENLLWTPEEARLRINTDLDNVLHDRSLWLCMPHCGLQIAQCYKGPVIFYSSKVCLTFFPLRHPPTTSDPIIIAQVNDNHFLHLKLDLTRLDALGPTIFKFGSVIIRNRPPGGSLTS